MLIDPYINILKRERIYQTKKPITKPQEWERKKCKSCAAYQSSQNYGMCAFPNNKACKYYEKRNNSSNRGFF